jgi:murein DD-endopeptidase MepM/ murein hydrolase activator NlpD
MGMYAIPKHLHKFRPRSKNHIKKYLVCVLGLLSVLSFFYGLRQIKPNTFSNRQVFNSELLDKLETPISLLDKFYSTKVRVYDEIRPKEDLYSALIRLNLSSGMAAKFSAAIARFLNLKLLLPGDVLMIESVAPSIQLADVNDFLDETKKELNAKAIELFSRDGTGVTKKIRVEVLSLENENFKVLTYKPDIFTDHALLNGIVTNNIHDAIVRSGGSAQLVNSFSDIYAWQFDFYRDTREGDTYQMIVEKNVAEGRFVSYGKILAAEYGNGSKSFRAFYFESKDKKIAGFFDGDGKSLRNAFLKAPLKIASITSRFGMRYHPVQKRMKPHNGVDYGANRGTPFIAVASGKVINAGYNPFNGNWISIRHMNGYETEYLHATNLAKGIRVGTNVKQGQVIGYVGKTGLATGYHLHFGMKLNGKYVNPTSQRSARSAGVPTQYMNEYKHKIEAMTIALNQQNAINSVLALNNEEKNE